MAFLGKCLATAVGWCCFLCAATGIAPAVAAADWLQDLETEAVAMMQAAGIPGMAIAIVEGDAVVYAKGFGYRGLDASSGAVNADTVFDIGSCSKAFVATELAMLADQQQLAWTDLVSAHLSGFTMYDTWVSGQFQVQDLLLHRSGLTPYSLFGMMFLGYAPDEVVRGLRYVQPVTSFRASFAYQNDMYMTASQLVAAKTGMSWRQHVAQSLFVPLGMSRTVTTQAEKNQLANTAKGNALLSDGTLWPIPADWSNSFVADEVLAAGAIKSSANDMAKWLRLHVNEGTFGGTRLVSADKMHFLHAPVMHLLDWYQSEFGHYTGPVGYGGGWMYFGFAPYAFLNHDGTLNGFKSTVGIIPGAKAGIVVLTNMGADFSGNPTLAARSQVSQKIAFRFYDLFLQRDSTAAELSALLDTVRHLSPEGPSPAAVKSQDAPAGAGDVAFARYVGAYHNPAYGTFYVTLSGETLKILMGPRRIQATLTPKSNGEFWAYLPDYPSPYEANFHFRFTFPESGPPVLTLAVVLGWPQNDHFVRIAPGSAVPLLLLGDS
jgi:CubicO group peptidase (beta-lactamase class C family)